MMAIGRPALAGAATLALGLLLAGSGALWQMQRNEREASDKFDALSQRVVAQVAARMKGYKSGLLGVRGAVVSAPGARIRREPFQRYAATWDPDREYPGLRGLGVIWRVPPVDQAAFVDDARRDGWPDFGVRQLAPHDGERYVIQYIEPVGRNRAAVGLDIASESNRREAAQAAMRSGQATLTGPITLVQATGKPTRSFLLLLPIYRPGAPLTSVEARESAAIGWSYAPLVIDEVLQSLDRDASSYALTLRDKAAADSRVFFRSAADDATAATGLQRLLDIAIYGRTWQAELHASPSFVNSLGQTAPRQVALALAGLAAVLALLVVALMRLRDRARSEQLEQARRAAIVASSDDAIVGASIEGVVTDWNAGAERLFGYAATEAIGRRVVELVVPPDLAAEESTLIGAIACGQRVAPFDTVRQHRDGTRIDVSVTAAPILAADGRCMGYAKTLRDTRAARATQRALAALNTNLEHQVAERTASLDAALHDLRSVLDAVPSMIGYWDRGMVNRMANRAYGDWFGVEADQLLGKTLRELLGEEAFEQSRPFVEAALLGQRQQFERVMARPDGSGAQQAMAHYVPDIVEGEVRGFYVLVHDVSELVNGRLRLAAAQRESEALLRTIHQHTIVSVADRGGRITEVNEAFCAISGYTREELIGRDHRILNSGHQPREFWVDMWRTVSGGVAWRAEVCNRAKDGSLYWVDSIIAPFYGADGKIEKYISIRSDITSRHRMEAELQRTNDRLLLAAGSVGLGVWEYDLVAGVLVWDERMYELYGRSKSGGDEPYSVWRDSLHPDDRARSESELQAAIAGTRAFDTTFRVRLPDGAMRHLKAAAHVTRDADGRALRMIGVNVDVTERARLDAELSSTVTLLNSVLDSATQASIVAVQPDGLVSVFNAGAQRLLGYRGEEVIGRETALKFHHAEEIRERAAALSSELGRTVHTGMVLIEPDLLGRAQDWHYKRKDGSLVPVSLAVTAMHGPDGALFGYLGIAHDVSRQKEQERELHQAVHKARQASRAKSRFLANMSHEIRTPMNAVIGLSYLLENSALDANQSDLVMKIKLAGKSLLGIINNVLDESKIEAGEMQVERAPFDMDLLLQEIYLLASVQAQAKGIRLTLDVHGVVQGAFEGDAARLQQVLLNLVNNAVKFTEKGSVSLSLRGSPAADGRMNLRFVVTDTGFGIEPETLKRLFRPFMQADSSTTRRFGGTGLGLSIVRQLVTLMGGRVGVSSTPGAGSVFWIELALPHADDGALGRLRIADPRGENGLAGVRVLVADDSEINREVARRILELHGATVGLVGNGQEAVDRLRESPAEFDVVLMDIQMPVLGGLDATRRIRDELGLSRLPVIALTAGALGAEQQAAEAAGMNDFLSKPFDPRALVRCLLRHVDAEPRIAADPVLLAPAAGWPVIHGIDASDARRRLGGDVGLFKAMLKRLLADFADLGCGDVEAANDLVGLAARLHNLKGSAGTLGAKAIEQLAAQAESASRTFDAQRALALTHDLGEHLVGLRSAAAVLFDSVDTSEGPGDSAADADLAPEDLSELLTLLRGFNLEATSRFAALAPRIRQSLGDASYALVHEQMESLQFDRAVKLLEELQQ